MLVFIFALLSQMTIAGEGLYYPDELPPKYLQDFQIKKETVDKAYESFGFLWIPVQMTFATKEDLKKRIDSCSDARFKKWNQERCDELIAAEPKCENGCTVQTHRFYCPGVFVTQEGYNFFATARHCFETIPLNGADLGEVKNKVVFEKGGKALQAAVSRLFITTHYLPFDVTILRVDKMESEELSPTFAKLEPRKIESKEAAFAIGYPTLGTRTKIGEGVPDYSFKIDGPRVAFGRVVEPNNERQWFCRMSKEIGRANGTSWKLEPSCSPEIFSALDHNAYAGWGPILTDTDMTYGMSGSALFDSSGKLIGIGSTTTNSSAADYNPAGKAVYFRNENLKILLDMAVKRLSTPSPSPSPTPSPMPSPMPSPAPMAVPAS